MNERNNDSAVDKLLGRLAGLLEWQGLGTAALTPRPRGGRLHGADAEEVASLLEELAAADAELPAGRRPRSLIFGNGCFAIGRYAEALTVYQALVGERPNDFAVHFNLGVTFLRRRQPEEAVRVLTRALELDAFSAPAYYQRGNARDDMGDGDGALDDYATAIGLNPDYIKEHYNRG
ncbi:MAG: tetratricopeptide repeat protein, partial [Chloroflexi bacterium]|nr:tetratricopeptide repeat protein [Chloroflexota bacterium]